MSLPLWGDNKMSLEEEWVGHACDPGRLGKKKSFKVI